VVKLFARYRRRRPGVYLYRTFRHMKPGTEWGYAGKSRDLDIRKRCHAGTCGRHPNHLEKPWYDLVVSRRELRLPWWLGWDWITLSLETLLILAIRPRYNWQKNPRPGKVGPRTQAAQRAARDRARDVQLLMQRSTVAYGALKVLGIAIILVGIGGYWWSR